MEAKERESSKKPAPTSYLDGLSALVLSLPSVGVC